jgi:methionine-rich copper-binding protein CopC
VPAAVRHPVRPLAAALVTVVTATLALAFLAGPAWAGSPPRGGPARDGVGQDGPQVHHVSPENGAVLRTAPDHFEIMFDVELVPGRAAVGITPDATGRLVALPAPPALDGPLLVQPLPPLAAGRYTVGVQLLGADGQLSRGTFGFTVDPTAAAAPGAGEGGAGDGGAGDGGAGAPAGQGRSSWLVPLIGVALLLPAAGLVRRRRATGSPTARVTPRPPAAGAVRAGPGRAAGRTPTSASSPAGRPGR